MPFPLFTDAHVQQHLVDALVRRGWDVVRTIDTFPEGTGDDVLFEHAVREGRFFVTNDGPAEAIGIRWPRFDCDLVCDEEQAQKESLG